MIIRAARVVFASILLAASAPAAFADQTKPPATGEATTAPDSQPDKPQPAFFGVQEAKGRKIVFVLDHSGSMLDTFDMLRDEVKKTTSKLTPVHKFAVVMFSEQVDGTFPKAANTLASGTPDTRRDFGKFIDNIRAEGRNDGEFDPFAKAMQKAFSLQPDVIYFLTDGGFNPKLVDEIKKLNAAKKVTVHTIAFIKVSDKGEQSLRAIAKDNGGEFKYVKESDLRR